MSLGTTGNMLHQCMPQVFTTAKRVRHQTDITRHAGTIPCVIRELIRQVFPELSHPSILYYGASEMNIDIAAALATFDLKPAAWSNRSIEKAASLAQFYEATCVPWNRALFK